ncbi:MAG: HD-GYP domain-containing protein, partial [Chloroflexota bacterium]
MQPRNNASSQTPPVPDQLQRFAEELRKVRTGERAHQQTLNDRDRTVRVLLEQEVRTLRDLRTAHRAERARRVQLEAGYLSTIRVLAAAVEARDAYAGGHIARVAEYSAVIARRLRFSDQALAELEAGALLHDLGNIGVPDAVLNKTTALDPGERFLLQQHPAIGANLLRQGPLLAPLAQTVASHHERWDGTGYPEGIGGARIPLAARIVAVADAFDAMTSPRAHRPARDRGAARAEIERRSGTQFDPEVVAAFTAAFEEKEIA